MIYNLYNIITSEDNDGATATGLFGTCDAIGLLSGMLDSELPRLDIITGIYNDCRVLFGPNIITMDMADNLLVIMENQAKVGSIGNNFKDYRDYWVETTFPDSTAIYVPTLEEFKFLVQRIKDTDAVFPSGYRGIVDSMMEVGTDRYCISNNGHVIEHDFLGRITQHSDRASVTVNMTKFYFG